jgi:hypothetical protein
MPKHSKKETVSETVVEDNQQQQSEKIDSKFKRFYLVRKVDKTGVSGCGKVAQGIQFSDGSCVLKWLSTVPSTNIYHSVVEMEYIHTHHGDGLTKIEWVD